MEHRKGWTEFEWFTPVQTTCTSSSNQERSPGGVVALRLSVVPQKGHKNLNPLYTRGECFHAFRVRRVTRCLDLVILIMHA